jgi:two-component system response regulator PilR (NtrC family)
MTTTPALRLLVVDDEPDLRTLYELTLLREGYDVETAASVEQALERLSRHRYDALITDLRLPDGSGLELLARLEADARSEKTIVITAYGSAENAVEALKAGAYDYLTKPVDLKQFRHAVASAVGRRPAPLVALPAAAAMAASAGGRPAATTGRPARSAAGASMAEAEGAPLGMAGRSAAIEQVRALVGKVARSMAPVLIAGESGTGKELVARAVHETSARAAARFVAVNCSAIPEQLLEAEFFGYRKGAFTGAVEDREGFFQAAHGGTLFLDEIGDLPLAMQAKLLRAIQERAVRPVGAVAEQAVSVRLLSATHKDLAAEVRAGRFRQDLYYRLNVIPIMVPPLRERLVDLPDIALLVLARLAHDAGVVPVPQLTPRALDALRRQPFPGNVRELENLLHRAVALSGADLIDAEDLGLDSAAPVEGEADVVPVGDGGPASAGDAACAAAPSAVVPGIRPGRAAAAADERPLPADLAGHLDEVERAILLRALDRHRNNRTAAGASLGLSLRQMRYRMARLGIVVANGDAFGSDGA